MAAFPLRIGLWFSLVVVGVAVYLRLQQPLQGITSSSNSPDETFCYAGGVTTKYSTGHTASCFTVKDGIFTNVFTPTSELPVEARPGHAIPGLWDGVSGLFKQNPNLFQDTVELTQAVQHGHLAQYGEFLHSVDLFGSSSIDEVHSRLAAYLAKHHGVGGKNDWVRGIGWDQMALGGMPTAVMTYLSTYPHVACTSYLST